MISPGKGKVTELRLHREQAKPSRGRKKNKLVLLFSVFFVGYLVVSMGSQINRLQGMQSNVESLQTQIEELKTRNAALRQEIKQIKSDSYIEQVAREQLGLVKPGETLVVQAQQAQTNGTIEGPATQDNKKTGETFNIRYKNIYD